VESPPVPQDVLIARAIRALRDAVVGCGAACLGLAVVAAAILALSGSDTTLVGPAVSVLGGGQLLAITGAVVGALGLRAVLAGRPPARTLATTSARLRWVQRAVLAWCVVAVAAWTVADPATAVLTLALGVVSAQLAIVLVLVRRRLTQAR